MYELLRMKNSGLRKDVMAFTQELIDTPSPSMGEKDVADKVAKQMEILGYHHVYRDEVGNVIGVIHGHEQKSTLLLNSHMDTYQTGEQHQVRVEGHRIYGTGASDCKGGLASQVFAGALLLRSLLPLQGTLVVTASVAEENGAGRIYRSYQDRTKYTPFQAHEVEIHDPVFPRESEGRVAVLRIAKRMQVADQAQHILTETQHDVRLLTQHRSSVSVSVEVCREQQISYAGQEMQVQRITNAWATDPFDPLIDRSRQVLAAAGSPSRPGKWQLDRLGMGTAGATLLNEYNIPTIGYGPGHMDLPNHQKAFHGILSLLEKGGKRPDAVGHRVVHGGRLFKQPSVITPTVFGALRQVRNLAPLHNPPAIDLIEECQTRYPTLPQGAVFVILKRNGPAAWKTHMGLRSGEPDWRNLNSVPERADIGRRPSGYALSMAARPSAIHGL